MEHLTLSNLFVSEEATKAFSALPLSAFSSQKTLLIPAEFPAPHPTGRMLPREAEQVQQTGFPGPLSVLMPSRLRHVNSVLSVWQEFESK